MRDDAINKRLLDRLAPARTVVNASSPILICPALRPVAEWPGGDVDLRGGVR
ncbi:hypothetical protein ACUH9X_01875 [Dermabacteraceae bacterium P13147]